MPVLEPRYRTLGLTVPVADVLDARLWRLRYAVGTNAGVTPQVAADPSTSEGQACIFGGEVRAILEGAIDQEQAALAGELLAGLPDSTIRWHLRAALSEAEVKLGVPMGVEIVKSNPIDVGLVQGVHYDRVRRRLPFYRSDMSEWWVLRIPEPSVISVERVRAFYFGTQVWHFDGGRAPGETVEVTQGDDVIRLVWGKQGIAHLLPVQLSAFIAVGGSDGMASAEYGLWNTITQHQTAVPDFWAIDYTVGPVTRSGEVGRIEAVIADWVSAVAAMKLLSIAGLQQSRGLTSASVSMDGVSQSVGLQASAIYGLNSALENVYKEAEKRIDWRRLRAYKQGIRVVPYGF